MPLQAMREPAAHPRLGLTQDQLSDPVGIVRDVQSGPGSDLDDAPLGAAHESAAPAAHACDLTEPDKRVVHQGHDPQPYRRGRAGLEFVAWFDACDLGHAANVRTI